jgi:hypothetical protein
LTRFVFSEISSNPGFTQFHVVNPNQAIARLNFERVLANGTASTSFAMDVKAEGAAAFYLTGEPSVSPVLPGASNSAPW